MTSVEYLWSWRTLNLLRKFRRAAELKILVLVLWHAARSATNVSLRTSGLGLYISPNPEPKVSQIVLAHSIKYNFGSKM